MVKPRISKKTVTLKQVVAAIRKNGFHQAKVALLKYDGRSVHSRYNSHYAEDGVVLFESACAVGQAAVNLGVDADDLERVLGNTILPTGNNVYALITRMNDIEGLSCEQIAERLEQSGRIIDSSEKYLLIKRQYLYKPRENTMDTSEYEV